MDLKSRDEGRLGLPVGRDTNIDDYMDGRRAAESGTNIPGAAFTLIIVSPFLWMVYPVLGVAVMGIFLGVLYLLSLTPLPPVAMIVLGVILGIAGFFPAYKLEALASQLLPYRFVRTLMRPISMFGVTVALRTGAAFDNFHGFDINKVPGDKLLEGFLVALAMHFVLRRADRLYFPVWSQVRKREARQAKGLPDQRPFIKRFVYSLFWIIPVVAVMNLIVRGIVAVFYDGDQEIAGFYKHYSMFVYIFDFSVWCTLAFIGLLPGSAKIRKYGVGESVES